MGNRAIIRILDNETTFHTDVYLHWHGSVESVLAFTDYALKYCRRDSYFTARLIQIIGNYIGGNLSLGVCGAIGVDGTSHDVWGLDNGIYLIDYTDKDEILRRNLGDEIDYRAIRASRDYQQVYEEIEMVNELFFNLPNESH